ncbi:retrovirus-related pol polyprotein from transposon TNT 1-94 [Tanacetum coccineum]
MDKEVNMGAGDYDDALVCCVENMIDDRIMDFGASFHATYCKEELERFKLRSGKVRLADDKTLDIAGIGDVVLKTSFGTSWTLKDVRCIPGLKKRFIFVGQLDEEGYHVGFRDQQWKVTKGKQKKVSFVKSRNTRKLQRLELVHTYVYGPTSVASVGGSRYYVTFIDDSDRKVKCLKSDNGEEYSSREFIEYYAENGIRMLKTVPETPQQNSDSKGHKVVRSRDVTFNEDSLYGAKDATDSSNLIKPNQKGQVVLEDSPENLTNKSIVAEHGLSSEITQSPGGSLDTSEGSKNSGSFEDSGRSDEEESKYRASSKEEGSKTPHVRRSTRESIALVSYSPSANYLLVTENGEPKSYSEALNYQQERRHYRESGCSGLKKSSDEVYFAFGRRLEELHMTLADLEKKWTKLRTYTNIAQEFLYSGWRRRHQYNVTPVTTKTKTASLDLTTASEYTTQPII